LRCEQVRLLAALEAQLKHFAYARFMEGILPMVLATKFEDSTGQPLEAVKLGVITGDGTQMGPGDTIVLLEYRVGEQQMSVEIA